jgi:formate C-acetyltransferase
MKASGWKVCTDRERWTVKSWKETEGEDLQIRRAKLLKCVLDNIEINIHPFDEIVGRPTPWVIGCQTAIDCCGDYIPGIWDDTGSFAATLDATVSINSEGLNILRESARLFREQSLPAMTYKAWEELVGSWAKDVEAAKLKDPSLDSVITGQSTSVLSWKKILRVGLRVYIDECKRHIDEYIDAKGTDIHKIYFWQSSIIVLQAVIDHAHRYAALAEDMAAKETDEKQKAHLLKIAEVCRCVPENPARNLREALQSMQFCNLAKMLENPIQNNCHWGRADQYLYDYFMNDLKNGVPLEEIASMLATKKNAGAPILSSPPARKGIAPDQFGINNVM